jgi:uncharacterized protein YuzE
MTIQYFEDTDPLYLVFKDAEVQDTKDLDENTLVEFDGQGNVVNSKRWRVEPPHPSRDGW